MKWFLLLLLTASLQAQAFTSLLAPSIIECTSERLTDFERSPNTQVYHFSKNISIESLELSFGDPALWSSLYLTKIEFPSTQGNKCFLLENALLKSARALSYSADIGRLIAIELAVATYDNEAQIGETTLTVRVRVNQALGLVQFD
jgi:hypothetical protein